MISWQWSTFVDLSKDDLYSLLSIRQAVFIVEQESAYQDADSLDQQAWHLIGRDEAADGNCILAYARLVYPGVKYPEPSIGRVLVNKDVRRLGIGKSLMNEAIMQCSIHFPNAAIRISAQQYLVAFYGGLGFEVASDVYLEDGIPHIEMLRPRRRL